MASIWLASFRGRCQEGDLWQVYQIKWLWSNDSKNNLRIHHISQNLDLQSLEMFAFLESAGRSTLVSAEPKYKLMVPEWENYPEMEDKWHFL